MSAKQRIFLDTNVLVYQFDRSDPIKQKKAEAIIGKLLQSGSGAISSQVVQEFISVALKKFDTQLPAREVEAILSDLLKPLRTHFPNIDYYRQALSLYMTNSLSFYDALIVQAAIDLGCDIL